MITRRDVVVGSLASAVVRAFPLSVEGYIFQQYAERNRKPLAEVVPEVFQFARAAGFLNIELNPAFFTGELREKTTAILRTLRMRMPSIYVGGPMHTAGDANRTIVSVLDHAQIAEPFGCKGVVHNPDPKPGGQAKTDQELAAESDGLNRMGRALADKGLDLRVHHHTPQLENGAREWRYILAHTDPDLVRICVDVDWAYEGGFEPVPFLREVGGRLRELHVRSARKKIWLEDVEDSDIDYYGVAEYLRTQHLSPLIVVELAYRPQTVVTRSLEENLRRSREYTERAFALRPSS